MSTENKVEENAIKIEQGKTLMDSIGYKCPERITMFFWNKIIPVQKKMASGDLTDIEGVIQMYIALNTSDIKTNEIESKIMDMELLDFENISLYIWKILEKWNDKKK